MADSLDTKGYYAVLGVSSKANAEQIKRAFRNKAKEYHPDRNKSANAQPLFLRINEAYQTLSDTKQRAAYDALPPPHMSASRTVSRTEYSIPDPAACARCGQISAQPRYVILRRVIGFILISRRTNITGVFCRACADHYALRASLLTWLFGWWSFPRGPVETVAALWLNLWGGSRPRGINSELLERQTRAFAGRGNYTLAAAALQQAKALADSDMMLARLSALQFSMAEQLPTLKLVDRWRPLTSRAFYIQLTPFMMILALLSYGAIGHVLPHMPAGSFYSLSRSSAPAPAVSAVPEPLAGLERNVWNIAVDGMSLRRGPGLDYAVIRRLPRFTPVFRFAVPPGGDWALVQSADGLIGYLPVGALNPGSTANEHFNWCALGPVAAPDSGTILQQVQIGQHALSVENASRHDMVVKLKDATGVTALAFYVKANSTAQITNMAAGTYRLSYATGSRYSPNCGMFLDTMRAAVFENNDVFAAPTDSRAEMAVMHNLNPDDGRLAQARPIPVTDFLDDRPSE
jgi:hypothetical protein